MNSDKIKQIEDLIDLAYEHCSCEDLSPKNLSKKTKKTITQKPQRTKHTKWQRAFINSEIFKRII